MYNKKMILHKLICSVILLNSFLLGHAVSEKATSEVIGKVLFEKHTPLEGAQVTLLTERDSSFVTGTNSDKNGVFTFKQLNAGRYFIQVAMLGYRKENITAFIEASKSITLAPICMEIETQNLQAVVVSAKKPPVEMLADKTVINLGSFALNSGGSAFSVMQNLPGVIVSNDGAIFLYGKSGTKILIDGKTSYLDGKELVNYLKSTPSSSIDKVELITNPSAKDDASGNSGIINIKTKRSKLMGFNMAVNANYEQGKYGRTNDNITFNHRNGKLNVFGMYGYYKGADFNDAKISRIFNQSLLGTNTIFDQNSYHIRTDDSHYFNAGIHYFATANTTFELSANGFIANQSENNIINSSFYTYAGKNDSILRSSTNNINRRHNLSTSFNMTHKIDSMGKEISFSLDYLHYSVHEEQLHDDLFTTEMGTSSEAYSKGLKNGTIGMYSGRADLSYPISDKLSFEAGCKSILVNINNSSVYENKAGNDWLPDYELSSRFIYRENINAAYVSAKVSQNQFHMEAGIRMENTNIKGDQPGNQEIKDSIFSKSYTNIFPTATLSYISGNKNSLNLTYGRRIDRPNYRDLNPFIYIFDAYTYEKGNTALQPQFSHNFDLSYIIKSNYRVSLFYTNTEQAIMKSYILNELIKRVYVMPTNMSFYNSYGIRMSIGNLSVLKFLQSSLNVGITRNDYSWTQNNVSNQNGKTTFMFNMNNRISLPKDWSAELSGFYNGEMALGQMSVFPLWQLSAGIQKKCFKGNGTLGIYSNDIFNTNITKVTGLFNGTIANVNERHDRCILGVSFSYWFKKGYESKEFKKKGESFDSKRINL